MRKFRLAPSFSTVSGFASMIPTIVYAAVVERTLQTDAGTLAFWAACGAVQFLTASGYAASSLPKWGGWRDGDATVRLTLIAGMIGALLAGNMAYYIGLYYFAYQQIPCFAASIGGGFLGEKALNAYFEKFVGRLPQPSEKP